VAGNRTLGPRIFSGNSYLGGIRIVWIRVVVERPEKYAG
jgi:hypothetical protein